MASNRAPEAEPYLKTVAEAATDAGPRIALADYYVFVNRSDEALRILEAASTEGNFFATAKSRVASIQYAEPDRRRPPHD